MIPTRLILTGSSEHLASPEIQSSLRDIRARNQGWIVNLFSDVEQERFVRSSFSRDVYDAYASINPLYGAARADLFRYLAVYKLGGVYLDIKSTCTVPLSAVLRSDDHFVLAQWDNKIGGRYEGWGLTPDLWDVSGGEYVNWFFAARASHPLILSAVSYVLNAIKSYEPTQQNLGRYGILRTTGPIAWTRGIVFGMRRENRSRSLLPRIESCSELRLLYSVFNREGGAAGAMEHRKVFVGHYTHYSEPVVVRS